MFQFLFPTQTLSPELQIHMYNCFLSIWIPKTPQTQHFQTRTPVPPPPPNMFPLQPSPSLSMSTPSFQAPNLKAVVLTLECASELPQGLLEFKIAGATPSHF